MKKRIAKISAAVVATVILAIGFIALRIFAYRNTVADVHADAAIVLGAAVWGNEPSPVFRERINHAVDLYRTGKVRMIIFTGGQGTVQEPAESSVARQSAIGQGVPPQDILVEKTSHTTYENLFFARKVAQAEGLKQVLIVSDPLHMKRAVSIAVDLGFEANPSPTPTSKYQSAKTQLRSLAHETYYYIGYLMRRRFMTSSSIE